MQSEVHNKNCSSSKCKESNPQPLSNFYTNSEKRGGGPSSQCKSCIKERTKKWASENEEKVKINKKEYRANEENRERNKQLQKQYRKLYKEEYKIKDKEYYEKNKQTFKEKSKEYRTKNKIKLRHKKRQYDIKNKNRLASYRNQYWSNRRKTDILYKLKINIRSRTSKIFKLKGLSKDKKSIKLLGCTLEHFKSYIESFWEPDMNWNNYGSLPNQWCLDHTIPLASANTKEELEILSNYKNIKPMWSKLNILKNDLLPEQWRIYELYLKFVELILKRTP